MSIMMLILTSIASFLIFRAFRPSHLKRKPTREDLYYYYREQRRRARDLSSQFDLTDEEIDQKVEEDLRK